MFRKVSVDRCRNAWGHENRGRIRGNGFYPSRGAAAEYGTTSGREAHSVFEANKDLATRLVDTQIVPLSEKHFVESSPA